MGKNRTGDSTKGCLTVSMAMLFSGYAKKEKTNCSFIDSQLAPAQLKNLLNWLHSTVLILKVKDK
uniref:Uncharacterized protein n=1 Tax=Rhizophora mucronata TaxID=61149 RepID=A0A2P2IQU5_RHIMU